MFVKLAIAVVVAVSALLVYVAVKPSDFAVERTITISANTAVIFPFLNNVKKAEDWNPFSKGDLAIQKTFDTNLEGVGAKMYWSGNSAVGEGSVTIIESILNQKVRVQLDFKRPFAGQNFGEYTLVPIGYETMVKWRINGNSTFFPRLVCVFIPMDKLLGGKMESGLAELKRLSEIVAKP